MTYCTLYGSFSTLPISSWNDCNAFCDITLVFPVVQIKWQLLILELENENNTELFKKNNILGYSTQLVLSHSFKPAGDMLEYLICHSFIIWICMMIQKLSLLILNIWVILQSFTTMYARGVLQISSDEDDWIRAKIKTQNNP